jgi:hypothetical protein
MELRPGHFAACHLAAVTVGEGRALSTSQP